MTTLTLELVQKSLEENAGNLHKAAETLKAKYQTVYYWARKYKLPYASEKPLLASKEQLDEAYKRLGSLSAVAEELGGTKEGIRCAMKRHGLKIAKLKRYSVDELFFDNETEASFYWAGFIAADGCVKYRKVRNSDVYELQIGLAIKDLDHLKKFKKDIDSTAPIHQYIIKNSKRNPKWNDCETCQITIVSKYIFESLAKFNIVSRKSLIYTFPDWIINHQLANHFMRGYFDGDGSFYKQLGKDRKAIQTYFCLRGTTEFLETYRSLLESNCDIVHRESPIRVNNGIGALEYGGNTVLSKIARFLYKDATIYLDRKREFIKHLLVG